ncbi:MAG: SufB/SufD family protein [Candidatus Micrarchaeales archaeon]
MEYYKSFNAEALELSKSLPEQQSELYKKHFVPLNLDAFAKTIEEGNEDSNEEKTLKELSADLLEKLRINFDIIIGSTTHIVNKKSKYVKIIEINELTEEHFVGRMYKSNEDKIVAFLHAYSKKVIFIDIPAGEKADLNILFANTDLPLTTQVIVTTGNVSVLNLFEWYASKANEKSVSGVLHEIKIGSYAKAEINFVHNENEKTYVLGFSKGRIGDNSKLKLNYIYNGGLITKVKNEIMASGYAASSEVIEMVMGSAEQKFDLNTVISNLEKDTVSDLESKAVLMDSAVCFLKGFANVGENAPGSRSFVNERGILLDKRAYMSSIPGMSINNSNVKATHSSATAPVEEDLLFYLMSRGADEVISKKLLISGFFSSSIAKMESPLVKEAAASLMNEKVNNKRFGTVPKMDISSIWFDPKAAQAQDMFAGHYKYREQQ